MLHQNEIAVDNFAGGGGASTGLEMALGRSVDIAINHDPAAIDMHKVNHPNTTHYCESVWDVDPVAACAGRPVGLAWFSPDCKHFSRAKGATPVNKEIRGLAWVAVRWAMSVPVRVFMLENVSEFLSWGPVVYINDQPRPCPARKGETFDGFIKALTTGLKPTHPTWLEAVRALNIEFNLVEKYKLFKGLGYCIEHKILKMSDYGVPTSRARLFIVARNDGAPISWPTPTHGNPESGLIKVKTAADIIDWSIPVKSIFNRPRPIAEKTLIRIAKGIEKEIINNPDPFIVPREHVAPFITEHANGSNQRNMALNEPLRTLCAQVKGGHFALVTSHIIKFRGDNTGHKTNEPLHTISAGGNHLGEVQTFLIKYFGTSNAQSALEPLGTITTKDRYGVVMIRGSKYQIVDIGMRMLYPHELYAAMGFPASYKIAFNSEGKKNTKQNQVARCGNAVCPPAAAALVTANLTLSKKQVAA
ncbi:DNA cytosine methyltransferase [Pseudoalteromonas sp. SR43-5]|uniref:DNA cytosine methyltransferase n=1 Tax=Pseudoalteromonas sp. SR43-5 TaxID=2760941 RepID=UPI0015FADA73|nr:DNA cytosine methyltransferase [Pseudoalteromonas sp. SR43-5]MBB1307788.1 DNA cytosine methyltransferase [Pseudoalteromonas sp. SR43-5]